MPPKTHNLMTLLAASELQPEEAMGKFIAKLNAASVATRYPEHLEKLQQIYTKEVTLNILDKTGETVLWIKNALMILSRFKENLEKSIRINGLILFGSCASDTGTEDSDIDVIVLSEDFTNKDFWERIEIIADAVYTTLQPIDAVAMTPAEWESQTTALAVYARSSHMMFVQ